MLIQAPDALFAQVFGDVFERAFQRVVIAQIGVGTIAEFFQRAVVSLLFCAAAIGVENLLFQRIQVLRGNRLPNRGGLLELCRRAHVERQRDALRARSVGDVCPECRHGIGIQIIPQQTAQFTQRMINRVGLAFGIGPPFCAAEQKGRQNILRAVFANGIKQTQQRLPLRRLRCSVFLRRPFGQLRIQHFAPQLRFVFQQRRAPRQARFQRRAFQQLQKPAMERRYRRLRLCRQHRFQQTARAWQQRFNVVFRNGTLAQKHAHRVVVRQRQQTQPLMQTVGHLLRRLARKRNRQQLRRRRPRQQQPDHA